MSYGEEGPRPQSEAQALDDAIQQAAAEHLAIDRMREDVLVERIAYVERHRKRLVADAERETEEARVRYLAAVAEAEAARADLIGLNETRVWASVFPSDTLATYAPSHNLVAGRRRETERHGFQSAVVASAVFDLLRSDAEVFRTVTTREQAAAMRRASRRRRWQATKRCGQGRMKTANANAGNANGYARRAATRPWTHWRCWKPNGTERPRLAAANCITTKGTTRDRRSAGKSRCRNWTARSQTGCPSPSPGGRTGPHHGRQPGTTERPTAGSGRGTVVTARVVSKGFGHMSKGDDRDDVASYAVKVKVRSVVPLS
jgi:hypothetical protein